MPGYVIAREAERIRSQPATSQTGGFVCDASVESHKKAVSPWAVFAITFQTLRRKL